MPNHRYSWLLAVTAALILGLSLQPAYAHGFGERYDLPVPLYLYVSGAGIAVALSFAAIGYFLRGQRVRGGYPTFDLLRLWAGRLLAHPILLLAVRAVSVGLFLLTVAAGALGSQAPVENLAPTMVWILWWVGIAYVSALLVNVWALINPLKIIFDWADALYRRFNPGDQLSLGRSYPEKLGVWPSFVLFFIFAWVELVYPNSATPRNIAFCIVAYSMVTWTGMVIYGKDVWLSKGEAFSVVFGLLARFAPSEVRVQDPARCKVCPAQCEASSDGCVDCYRCFAVAGETSRRLNIRPFGAGLLRDQAASPSLLALVVLVLATVTFDGFTATPVWVERLVLATVTFDGFTATPVWVDIVSALLPIFDFLGGNRVTGVETMGLLAFPALFLLVYWAFSLAMTSASGSVISAQMLARLFVFSLVPIALAYHLAHFLSFLLIQGQLIIPLASDPFGYGWNLLGTAEFSPNIAIVGARFAWITSVISIVAGHVIAVYVAHVVALKRLPHRAALRSQYPMLVLMVGYTMVSLWILAQPITEFTGS